MWRVAWVRSLAKAWVSQAWTDHVHLLRSVVHIFKTCCMCKCRLVNGCWKLNHPVCLQRCNTRQGQQPAVPRMQPICTPLPFSSLMSCINAMPLSRPASGHLTVAIMYVEGMCALQSSCDVASRVSSWRILHLQSWLQNQSSSGRKAARQSSCSDTAARRLIGRGLCRPWLGCCPAFTYVAFSEVSPSFVLMQLCSATARAAAICHSHTIRQQGNAWRGAEEHNISMLSSLMAVCVRLYEGTLQAEYVM